jgi:predicted nucleic acid-binding protein
MIALGRFVATVTMFVSVFIIVLPTSIIGSNVNNEWKAHDRAKMDRKAAKRKMDLATNLKVLREENKSMLQAIMDAQELLDAVGR